VTIVGLFLCMVLSLPAIWQGASITRALAQTFAIVRSRLLEAVLLLIFVGFSASRSATIIFGVLGFGLAADARPCRCRSASAASALRH
jgi:phosphate/sulfate permease